MTPIQNSKPPEVLSKLLESFYIFNKYQDAEVRVEPYVVKVMIGTAAFREQDLKTLQGLGWRIATSYTDLSV